MFFMFSVNNIKNKKVFLISIVLALFVSVTGISFFVFSKTMTLNYETIEIRDFYLKNYSNKKFIKTSLKNMDFYNKQNLVSHIQKNFSLFLKTNTELSSFIGEYATLYVEGFETLVNLKKNNVITSEDYGEINKLLADFKFADIINKTNYLTLKYNSNDGVANKKYFEGIIFELAFNYELARDYYLEAIKLNPHDIDYYANLGGVYYKLYNFDKAIGIFENGLNIPNLENRKYKLDEMELLYNLAKTYNTVGDFNKASATYTNLLIDSLEKNNDNYKWLSLYNLSMIEANYGNYNTAIDYLKYALNVATKNKNQLQIASSLNVLSKIQYKYGDYSRGVKNSLKAVKISKQISAMPLMAESSYTTCLNYEYLGKVELAKTYCARAIKINDTIAKTIGRPEYYMQNGNLYSFVGTMRDYNKALQYYEQAYNISNNFNLLILKSAALSGMSEFKNMLNDKDMAFKDLTDSNKIIEDLGIKNKSCFLCQLGFLYWGKNDYNAAIESYKQAITNATTGDNKILISNASSHLASVYSIIDNYGEALKYSELSLNTNKKIYRFDHHYIKYEEAQKNNILQKIEENNNNSKSKQFIKQKNK